MDEFKTINVNLSNLSEKEREQLLELIERSNNSAKRRWRGERHNHYYFISGAGGIGRGREDKVTYDSNRYQLGNYFKTEEEAEFELQKRLVYQELKDYALEHNECEFDWKNKYQPKWSIFYNNESECLEYNDFYNMCDITQIHFTSEEIARKAVFTVGEDRIKKYLFCAD